ncbi:hypothetical protein Anas_12803 [Armadillidium nasatum]|uniref:Uncharacterized protein n=1 Tax=Armadillidium nasatum TaxID=96803 RepID=A0A5N5SUG7_9CRUS|nr:hypothetical protein Anas_12803 [Armadillidium nasatum]
MKQIGELDLVFLLFLCDPKQIKEAFQSPNFADRPQLRMFSLYETNLDYFPVFIILLSKSFPMEYTGRISGDSLYVI